MGDWITGTRKGGGSCGSGTGCDVGGGLGTWIRKGVEEVTSEEDSSEDRSSPLCWQPLSPSLDDGGVGGDADAGEGGRRVNPCPMLNNGCSRSMTRSGWYVGGVEKACDCVCSFGLGGGVTADEVGDRRRRPLGFRTKNALGMLNTVVDQ